MTALSPVRTAHERPHLRPAPARRGGEGKESASPLHAGNQAIQALLRGGWLHAKLEVGAVDSPEEREADAVADRVMRKADGACCASCVGGGSCEDETVHRKPRAAAAGPAVPRHLEPTLRGLTRGGEPLSPSLRAFFEPRLGRDLSAVRLHRDAEAHAAARSIQARAFTIGQHIGLAGGESADSDSGRHLLAHELAHTGQQGVQAQVQRGANCKPARLSLQDCPPRVAGETERARSGPMVFLPGLQDPLSGSSGVLIANFDIGSAAIKPNLHDTIYWQEFLARIGRNGSRWRLLGFTDCQGAEGLNRKLRQDRVDAVLNILPPAIRPQIVAHEAASLEECVTENSSPADRTLNRSVAFVLDTSIADMEPEEIEGSCVPPPVPQSSGKRCKFYVYDSTEPTGMAWKWKVAAFALASPRPGAYVIPSGNRIEDALKGIFDTYAAEGCGCTAEVQFWNHGSPGNAMSISASNEELTIADFSIPGLEQFGDGPTSMPGYREWHDKLTVRQRRLVLLRRTICDSDAEVYYRSCEAFQGKTGQEFARASAAFWRSEVVGHTKVIALTQPGKKSLRPCQEPYWSESEGTEAPSPKKPVGIGADQKPKKE